MNTWLTRWKLLVSAALAAGGLLMSPSPVSATTPEVDLPGWACAPAAFVDDSAGRDLVTCVSVDNGSEAVLRVAHAGGVPRQWWLDVTAADGSTLDRNDLVDVALEVTETIAPADVAVVAGLTDTSSATGAALRYRVSGAAAMPASVNHDTQYLQVSMTAGVDAAPTESVTAVAQTSSVSTTALQLALQEDGLTCTSTVGPHSTTVACDGIELTIVGNRIQSLELTSPVAGEAITTLAIGGLAEVGAELPELLSSGEPRATVIGDLPVVVSAGAELSTTVHVTL